MAVTKVKKSRPVFYEDVADGVDRVLGGSRPAFGDDHFDLI